MSSSEEQKCLKCGASPSNDPDVLLFRFPKPTPINRLCCQTWAKFCYPRRKTDCRILHKKLYMDKNMLCSKHFEPTSIHKDKLHKAAVPSLVQKKNKYKTCKVKMPKPSPVHQKSKKRLVTKLGYFKGKTSKPVETTEQQSILRAQNFIQECEKDVIEIKETNPKKRVRFADEPAETTVIRKKTSEEITQKLSKLSGPVAYVQEIIPPVEAPTIEINPDDICNVQLIGTLITNHVSGKKDVKYTILTGPSAELSTSSIKAKGDVYQKILSDISAECVKGTSDTIPRVTRDKLAARKGVIPPLMKIPSTITKEQLPIETIVLDSDDEDVSIIEEPALDSNTKENTNNKGKTADLPTLNQDDLPVVTETIDCVIEEISTVEEPILEFNTIEDNIQEGKTADQPTLTIGDLPVVTETIDCVIEEICTVEEPILEFNADEDNTQDDYSREASPSLIEDLPIAVTDCVGEQICTNDLTSIMSETYTDNENMQYIGGTEEPSLSIKYNLPVVTETIDYAIEEISTVKVPTLESKADEDLTKATPSTNQTCNNVKSSKSINDAYRMLMREISDKRVGDTIPRVTRGKLAADQLCEIHCPLESDAVLSQLDELNVDETSNNSMSILQETSLIDDKGLTAEPASSTKEELPIRSKSIDSDEDDLSTLETPALDSDTDEDIQNDGLTADPSSSTQIDLPVTTETQDDLPATIETKDKLPVDMETQDDLPAAIETQNDLLAAIETQDDVPVAIETQEDLPEAIETQDNLPVTLETQDDLPGAVETQDDLPGAVETQDDLPATKETQNDLPAAIETQDDLPVAIETQENLPEAIETQDDLPVTLETQDDLPGAVETQDDLPATKETQNDLPAAIETQDNLPVAIETQENLPEAIETQDDLPVTLETQDDLPGAVETQDDLPATKETQDDLPAAIETQDKLPVAIETQEDLPEAIETQDNLPATLDTQDDLPGAVEIQDDLPATTETQNDLLATLETQDDLPATKETQDDLPAAIETQDKLPVAIETQEDLPEAIETQDNLPATLDTQDDLPGAVEIQDDLPATTETQNDLLATLETQDDLPGAVETQDDLLATTETQDDLPGAVETEHDLPVAIETVEYVIEEICTVKEFESSGDEYYTVKYIEFTREPSPSDIGDVTIDCVEEEICSVDHPMSESYTEEENIQYIGGVAEEAETTAQVEEESIVEGLVLESNPHDDSTEDGAPVVTETMDCVEEISTVKATALEYNTDDDLTDDGEPIEEETIECVQEEISTVEAPPLETTSDELLKKDGVSMASETIDGTEKEISTVEELALESDPDKVLTKGLTEEPSIKIINNVLIRPASIENTDENICIFKEPTLEFNFDTNEDIENRDFSRESSPSIMEHLPSEVPTNCVPEEISTVKEPSSESNPEEVLAREKDAVSHNRIVHKTLTSQSSTLINQRPIETIVIESDDNDNDGDDGDEDDEDEDDDDISTDKVNVFDEPIDLTEEITEREIRRQRRKYKKEIWLRFKADNTKQKRLLCQQSKKYQNKISTGEKPTLEREENKKGNVSDSLKETPDGKIQKRRRKRNKRKIWTHFKGICREKQQMYYQKRLALNPGPLKQTKNQEKIAQRPPSDQTVNRKKIAEKPSKQTMNQKKITQRPPKQNINKKRIPQRPPKQTINQKNIAQRPPKQTINQKKMRQRRPPAKKTINQKKVAPTSRQSKKKRKYVESETSSEEEDFTLSSDTSDEEANSGSDDEPRVCPRYEAVLTSHEEPIVESIPEEVTAEEPSILLTPEEIANIRVIATPSQTNEDILESYKTRDDVQIEILDGVQIEVITESPAVAVGGTSDTPSRATCVKRKAEMWIKDKIADDTEAAKSDNLKYWRSKLSQVMYNTQFCGICLSTDDDLTSIDNELDIVVGKGTLTTTLDDMLYVVFRETDNILSNSLICENCSNQLIQSYIFIQMARERSKILNCHVQDLYYKTCYIRNNALEENPKDENILINIENYDDVSLKEKQEDNQSDSPDEEINTPRKKRKKKDDVSQKESIPAKSRACKNTGIICKVCHKMIANEWYLEHMLQSHKQNLKLCEICDTALLTEEELDKHKEESHNEKSNELPT